MDLQQIFDRVATHLLRQGVQSRAPSREAGYVCMYRGDNGTSCAVGCLIKDEGYNPQMEGVVVVDLTYLHPVYPRDKVDLLANALRASGVNTEDSSSLTLLKNLQGIHDRTLPNEWVHELRRLAKELQLSDQVLDNTPSSLV